MLVMLDENNKVLQTNNVKHLLTDEQIAKYTFETDTPIPKQSVIENKIAVLYGDKETKKLWYEYEDIPIPQPTEKEIQDQRIADLEMALAEVLGNTGGGM